MCRQRVRTRPSSIGEIRKEGRRSRRRGRPRRVVLTVRDIRCCTWDVHWANLSLRFAHPTPHRRRHGCSRSRAIHSRMYGGQFLSRCPRFAERQQAHSIAIDQADLLKIDGDGAAFLIDRGTKDVNVVPGDPPADAQTRDPFRPEVGRFGRPWCSTPCDSKQAPPQTIEMKEIRRSRPEPANSNLRILRIWRS